MSSAPIPPVERSVCVAWDQPAAFRRFTSEFASWWPRRTHSVGGQRVQRVVFETRAGGRIFEEHVDGRRFQWGHVLEWDPPQRVRFTWHPSRNPATAQDVELRFVREGEGTRLDLVVTKWENWGPHARRARNGYNLGWDYVLNVWAGRRTATMRLLDVLGLVARGAGRLRGAKASDIARAGGEITGI